MKRFYPLLLCLFLMIPIQAKAASGWYLGIGSNVGETEEPASRSMFFTRPGVGYNFEGWAFGLSAPSTFAFNFGAKAKEKNKDFEELLIDQLLLTDWRIRFDLENYAIYGGSNIRNSGSSVIPFNNHSTQQGDQFEEVSSNGGDVWAIGIDFLNFRKDLAIKLEYSQAQLPTDTLDMDHSGILTEAGKIKFNAGVFF
ncbi:MAG: hypothetical protein HQM14_01005 [SAR324 cluster bacterium]|nr:hypothetical protein [SAR324 cluster bacterium]